MNVVSVIHILCETRPSLGTAVVNGVLALATMLGGGAACGAGLLAAVLVLDETRAEERTDLINHGMGIGFLVGAALGLLTLFVFIARVVS
jgi:hypothetical protein